MGSTVTKCMKIQTGKKLKKKKAIQNGSANNGTLNGSVNGVNGVPNGDHHQSADSVTVKRNNTFRHKSNLSLRRIGSFRNWLKTKPKHKYRDVDLEQSNETVNVYLGVESVNCKHMELYWRLCANDQTRSVIDEHPIFIEYSVERRKTLQVSVCECCSLNSVCVLQQLNNPVLHELTQSIKQARTTLPTEKLFTFALHLNGNNRSTEVIRANVKQEFASTFGESLRQIRLLTSFDDVRETVGRSFSCDISDVMIEMLFTHSAHYPNLVSIELVLSDHYTVKIFEHLVADFRKQLQRMAIKLYFDSSNFEQRCIETLDSLAKIVHLTSIHIELVPFVATQNRTLSIGSILERIAQLAEELPLVNELSLTLDIRNFECENVDLLQYLSSYLSLQALSLVVYGNAQHKVCFDFAHLRSDKLNSIQIDCPSITDEDMANLVANCPNVSRLCIGANQHLTSLDWAQHLTHLHTLSVGLAISSEVDQTTLIPIDSGTLHKLLEPQLLSELRTIRLEKCRIDITDDLNDRLIDFADANPSEQYRLILVDNHFADKRDRQQYIGSNFEDCFSENLNVIYYFPKTRHETHL